MNHDDLMTFLGNASNRSEFSASIGKSGGYINFKNSGRRGSVKEFTLSLETLLSGFEDILNNYEVFTKLKNYDETRWRDNGAKYFRDVALNTMITVQTKPTFCTFSKLICWANNIQYINDDSISIERDKLQITIEKLRDLIETYKPKNLALEAKRGAAERDDARILLPKSFVLLAGISGTGKTRFVREQASSGTSHCKIIPVRPDWHEPSDLLGYVSRISNPAKYIPTETLKFLAAAWRDAFSSATVDAVVLKNADDMQPFWLCLDEMNLAPVEQYFADYLSVLETRKWDGVGNYSCDPILKLSGNDLLDGLRGELEFSDPAYDGLWAYFSGHGIPLPPNLIVAGTVNMDETTHGFSRKVIDRALTFDFGEFFPNDYDQFFSGGNPARQLSFPRFTHATPEALAGVAADSDGALSIGFLKAVNVVLKGTPFELAYRALNELLLSVVCQNPVDEKDLAAVWDDFIMMKVLPRIEGDNEKLAGAAGDYGNVIDRLIDLLKEKFEAIEIGRPDFYRQNAALITVRSIRKLEWMKTRLSNNGFTSFWP